MGEHIRTSMCLMSLFVSGLLFAYSDLSAPADMPTAVDYSFIKAHYENFLM
jgi:hypothetical protein